MDINRPVSNKLTKLRINRIIKIVKMRVMLLSYAGGKTIQKCNIKGQIQWQLQ